MSSRLPHNHRSATTTTTTTATNMDPLAELDSVRSSLARILGLPPDARSTAYLRIRIVALTHIILGRTCLPVYLVA